MRYRGIEFHKEWSDRFLFWGLCLSAPTGALFLLAMLVLERGTPAYGVLRDIAGGMGGVTFVLGVFSFVHEFRYRRAVRAWEKKYNMVYEQIDSDQ